MLPLPGGPIISTLSTVLHAAPLKEGAAMKARVRSAQGYYARIDGKPAWVQSRAEAKVFRTLRLANGLVAILRDNGIVAKAERVQQREGQGQ